MSMESPQRTSVANAQLTPTSNSGTEPQQPAPAVSKPKRVRTGCLTCRERHLKCDEALPNCQNCRKSNRTCRRGLRLNFIDITCDQPPHIVPRARNWKISFQDDSRDIASEYEGGIEKYPSERSPKRRRLSSYAGQVDRESQYARTPTTPQSHSQASQQPSQPIYQGYGEVSNPMYNGPPTQPYEDPNQAMTHQIPYPDQPRPSFDQSMILQDPAETVPPHLIDRNETLYMQVFVEEVGIWMDSMDGGKHFSRLLPFHALRQPMLKHALLACGVRHLTLINPAYADEDAVRYYNLATQSLLKSLQNPDRDTVLCATTATVLNVYEVMSEKALQRMNHIAGARALIKECRWDANATGIGAACFWLNVGLEMFSCLHFNWGVAWDPDAWGIDMTMHPQLIGGNEESWTHKILWILAKITNFRASVPRFQEQSVHAEQMRMQQRHQQWTRLQSLCDQWDRCVPPTMHPMACVPAYLSSSKSSFPEVWYIKRATIVARLFYHTAMALLGSVNPVVDQYTSVTEDMQKIRTYHSRQICGIVAHVKDRGVASVSIRCLAIAGEQLTVRREQEEVLDIFDKIKKEAGWRVDFIKDELPEKWGWNNNHANANTNGGSAFFQQGDGQASMPTPNATSARSRFPSGIINPLYKNADFMGSNPPYQGNWVAPSQPPSLGVPTHQHGHQAPGQQLVHGVHGHTPAQGQAAQVQMYGYGGIQAL